MYILKVYTIDNDDTNIIIIDNCKGNSGRVLKKCLLLSHAHINQKVSRHVSPLLRTRKRNKILNQLDGLFQDQVNFIDS